jgi:hypothetical protein
MTTVTVTNVERRGNDAARVSPVFRLGVQAARGLAGRHLGRRQPTAAEAGRTERPIIFWAIASVCGLGISGGFGFFQARARPHHEHPGQGGEFGHRLTGTA